MIRRLARTCCGLAVTLVAAAPAAQQPAPAQPSAYRESVAYEGRTTVQTSRGPKTLTIAIKNLVFQTRQRGVRIRLPEKGVAILQHRAGEVEIVVGGRRRTTLEGERITVNLPQVVTVDTADDTVSIDLITVAE